ncbi:hypothetical protein [Streptacidiphilus sp. MAP12-20]|uniref:hypothetical protein n=1 Tax=Streptacidiphilus sp. MAP12-20 TaxID=3156299 RepID=UPI003511237A
MFTQHALPAIRPVNHIVDQGDIIIRSHNGADLVQQRVDPAGVRLSLAGCRRRSSGMAGLARRRRG